MKPFEREEQRYEYPLDADSVVVDVGAFQGIFLREIVRRFDCHVHAFEPIKEHFDGLADLRSNKVHLYNAALGLTTKRAPMAKSGDRSSLQIADVDAVSVEYVQVLEAVVALGGRGKIDLLKVNIEGAEYDLLEHLLAHNALDKVRFLQVQFHAWGAGKISPEERRNTIHEQLQKTFNLEWCTPFVWESWGHR